MSVAVAKRYAQALFEVAKERGTVNTVEENLALVKQVIDENPSFNQLLLHPQIAAGEKKDMIDQLFKSAVNSEVLNLLKVLVDNHRENIIAIIKQDYIDIANDFRGIADAHVTSARPLSDNDQQKIRDQFGQLLEKQLRLTIEVDKSLIGGVLVKIGNRVYDGSVAGQLERFKTTV